MRVLRVALCCMVIIAQISISRAEDKPEDVITRAERLSILRDRIVAEYGSWNEEFAKEDSQFAKRQRTHIEQFRKSVNVESVPAQIPTRGPALQIWYVGMSSILDTGNNGASKKVVLNLASGQLHAGPDLAVLKQESADQGVSLINLLAREVPKTGDIALLEYSFLVPSGRYANLGNTNLQYFSGEDISLRIENHDPACIVHLGDVVVVETMQKKYALVQYLGKYEGQVLLCVAYQPNGSALFEFGSLRRPTELDIRKPGNNPQEVATALFLQNREISFWKEVKALSGPLKMLEKNEQLTEQQKLRAKELKKKLGIID